MYDDNDAALMYERVQKKITKTIKPNVKTTTKTNQGIITRTTIFFFKKYMFHLLLWG